MQVSLVRHTEDPAEVIYQSARRCYAAYEDLPPYDESRAYGFIKALIRNGHGTPLEHAVFTFHITGISRVVSHQLVRYRIASFDQQSERAVAIPEPPVICPPSIAANPDAYAIYNEIAQFCYDGYQKLLALGIPKEDARYGAIQANKTALVFTMNSRALLHFFHERLGHGAQWEIKNLARKILEICQEILPEVFDDVEM